MEKRIMALILASVLTLGAVLTGCSTNAESSSPDISSQSSVPEGSAPEDSEETGHSEAPTESGESQTAPVTPESGSSGESVVYENPDTDPDMTAEELAMMQAPFWGTEDSQASETDVEPEEEPGVTYVWESNSADEGGTLTITTSMAHWSESFVVQGPAAVEENAESVDSVTFKVDGVSVRR